MLMKAEGPTNEFPPYIYLTQYKRITGRIRLRESKLLKTGRLVELLEKKPQLFPRISQANALPFMRFCGTPKHKKNGGVYQGMAFSHALIRPSDPNFRGEPKLMASLLILLILCMDLSILIDDRTLVSVGAVSLPSPRDALKSRC